MGCWRALSKGESAELKNFSSADFICEELLPAGNPPLRFVVHRDIGSIRLILGISSKWECVDQALQRG